MFDFPGCEGCPKALHTVRTVGSSEDPMKSMVWRGWINGFSRKSIMESFIHRENLALFRKRLAEPRDEAERQVLLKLPGRRGERPSPKKGELRSAQARL